MLNRMECERSGNGILVKLAVLEEDKKTGKFKQKKFDMIPTLPSKPYN